MRDVTISEVPLDILEREIIACVQRALRDQKKSDDWRTTARQKLIEAYRRTGGGAAFEAFLKPVCAATTLSLSYAYEIIGKTTEQSRADWRERNAVRARKKKAADSVLHGKSAKPLKMPIKTKSQPQLLAAFRKCVDAMAPETRRDALAYLDGKDR